jgi:hypothetical protein
LGVDSLPVAGELNASRTQPSASRDLELFALVRSASDRRSRLLAYDELLGRQQLCQAQFHVQRRSLPRIALLAGAAGAAFALLGALPEVSMPAIFSFTGCVLIGLLTSAVIHAQARARRRSLERCRAVIRRLRRTLDSGPTSS